MNRRTSLISLGFCLVLTAALPADIQLIPSAATLTGQDASQRFLVERAVDGVFVGEAEDAKLVSSDPSVVVVKDGKAIAVADGIAEIIASRGSETARAKIRVNKADRPVDWEFRRHVLPVLSKNEQFGACHGALAGKGGFRLSLRGYDADEIFSRSLARREGDESNSPIRGEACCW